MNPQAGATMNATDTASTLQPRTVPRRPEFVRPVRIGRGSNALAGLYQPAHDARCAVLICNPFGQEAIRAQRSLRVISDRLARQGIASLRFDYFATGDSPGEDGAGHMTRWQSDITLADVQLRQLSGCKRILWLGLRLGATLALQASVLHPDLPRPERVILWEPVLDGHAYLKHLRRMHEFWTREAGVTTEALGFLLSHRLRRHIDGIHPDTLPIPEDVALDLLTPKRLPGRKIFLANAEKHGSSIQKITLSNTVEWASNTALSSQWVPDEALSALLRICTSS